MVRRCARYLRRRRYLPNGRCQYTGTDRRQGQGLQHRQSRSSERSNTVLSTIGLTASDARKSENGINYFTSDALNNKLAAALAANATNVKNALETAVKNGGVAMTETLSLIHI